jgi:hypothetical protein
MESRDVSAKIKALFFHKEEGGRGEGEGGRELEISRGRTTDRPFPVLVRNDDETRFPKGTDNAKG